MRILVVSQYFYPENFRINALCAELVCRGHNVTVLTGYPQYPIGRIYDGYGFDIPYEKEWKGVRIERVKTYARGSTPFGLLRNCISFVRSANKWVDLCQDKYDAVFVFEVSPVTVGLPAITYKKKFGTPVFFNLQDLWPENVHEVLGIRFPPLTYMINHVVNRIYQNSDKILCTSNGFVKHLAKKGIDREKLIFWPQFCIEPNEKNDTKPEEYTDDTMNIVFTGNLGDAQGLDLIVEAARELKGQSVRWYLVGEGRAKERLENLSKTYGVADDIVFIGRVSEEEANRYVRFADCAYLSFKNAELFNMMLPAKLQTYLACGTPILAAAGGESAELIHSCGCGIAVNPDLDQLIVAVKEMADISQEERKKMSEAGKQYFAQNFTMDRLVTQLEQIMTQE